MNNRLPHYKVLTRLGVSKIHGIGVFALFHIKKGSQIFSAGDSEQIVWVEKHLVDRLPPAHKDFYYDFAIQAGAWFGCPRNFGHIPISWYCNHSDKPNLKLDSTYRAVASVDIKKGTELTLDYRTFCSGTIPIRGVTKER